MFGVFCKACAGVHASTGPRGSMGPRGRSGVRGLRGPRGHRGGRGHAGECWVDFMVEYRGLLTWSCSGARGPRGVRGPRGRRGYRGRVGPRANRWVLAMRVGRNDGAWRYTRYSLPTVDLGRANVFTVHGGPMVTRTTMRAIGKPRLICTLA